MKIRLLESAKEDLRSGWFFYESQSPGLGDYFLDRLHSDIDLLKGFGGIHSFEFGFQCMPAKRFPFAIFYLVEGDVVEVSRIGIDVSLQEALQPGFEPAARPMTE